MPAQMIRMVLLDGNPSGLRSAQIAGRTTIMTACPMVTIGDVYRRPEGDKPAVYIMIAPDPDGEDRSAVYVGECDSLVQRFRGGHQAMDRAEWNEILVVTTVDGVLNKAHALHVEDYLRSLVLNAGRARDMTRSTFCPTLDEGDLAFVASFADDAVVLARVLGIDVFATGRTTTPRADAANDRSSSGSEEDESPTFEYSTKNVRGLMKPVGSEFYLLAGSTLAKAETPTIPAKAARVRVDGLRASLIVDLDAVTLRVVKDIPLGSVSLAASVVSGSSTAGTIAWKHVQSGETYATWIENRNKPPSAADAPEKGSAIDE